MPGRIIEGPQIDTTIGEAITARALPDGDVELRIVGGTDAVTLVMGIDGVAALIMKLVAAGDKADAILNDQATENEPE